MKSLQRPKVSTIVTAMDYDPNDFNSEIPPNATGIVITSESRNAEDHNPNSREYNKRYRTYEFYEDLITPHYIEVRFNFKKNCEDKTVIIVWSKQTVGKNILESFYQDCETKGEIGKIILSSGLLDD